MASRLTLAACLAALWAMSATTATAGPSSAEQNQSDASDVSRLATDGWIIGYGPGDQDVADAVAAVADETLRGIETAFGVDFPEPIEIRVFPDTAEFVAAQPMAVEVEGFVARSPRSRLVTAIDADEARSRVAGVPNALRRELTYLALDQLGESAVPDLFVEGLAGYLQRANEAMPAGVARLRSAAAADSLPPWEAMAAPAGGFLEPPLTQPAARSVVFFLADLRGHDTLLAAIRSMAGGTPWATALGETYQASAADLERQWAVWLPRYLDGGWRANPLFPSDLADHEQLLAAGHYAAALELITWTGAVGGVDAAVPAADVEALAQAASAGVAATTALDAGAVAMADGRYADAVTHARDAEALASESPALRARLAPVVAAARELGARAEKGLSAAQAAESAHTGGLWRAPLARRDAVRAAREFAQLGNQIEADAAASRAEELDTRLAPAGWALVLAGAVALVHNLQRRRAAKADIRSAVSVR